MLKFIKAALLGCVAALVLTACGDKSKVEDTALQFTSALYAGDYQKADPLIQKSEDFKTYKYIIEGKLEIAFDKGKEMADLHRGVKKSEAAVTGPDKNGVYTVKVKTTFNDDYSDESTLNIVKDTDGQFRIMLSDTESVKKSGGGK